MNISYDDIHGIVGILPTPATDNADRWDAENTVNLEATSKMTSAVIEAGIDVIMGTGTFGEGASLTWDELQAFNDCVIQTIGGRRPFFAGVTTLNTRDTISRSRELIRLGADGIFSGRPMWIGLDDKQIVRYYRDLAEALPGIPLVVYDNPEAFKGKISAAVYHELTNIPTVICAKHVGGPALESDIEAVGDRIRLLPLEKQWYPIARKYPTARACWSGNVACAPHTVAALGRAVLSGDWEEAKVLHDKVAWACETQYPDGDPSKFMAYSIQLGHARFRTAGLIDPGPVRPPYVDVPEAYLRGSEEVGRRWRTLEAEYAEAAFARSMP